MNTRSMPDPMFAPGDDPEVEISELEDEVDHMAIELLTGLCGSLSYALSGMHGKSRQKAEMRDLVIEYKDGITAVLAMWKRTSVEVIDGPGLSSLATPPLYD